MADEDNEPDQDTPEPEPRLFTLTEAERARRELEPLLVEAMDCRKKLAGLDNDFTAVSARIMMMGGVTVPYGKLSELRTQHQQLAETFRSALNRILETGCLIKDLEIGLLDFPSLINNEEVYLCWKLGEDRIRFYHRQDEGFAARKPLDPRDVSPGGLIQ
ncbi:MAG TPA: DUF2203 domain-containing protein [Candidatus Acidoferrum sp.]|nr:DUF2203 domain-containing protein [Candidatus Acidoferrum sp.]